MILMLYSRAHFVASGFESAAVLLVFMHNTLNPYGHLQWQGSRDKDETASCCVGLKEKEKVG